MSVTSRNGYAAGSSSGRDPSEIERDIDATREELAKTLDALQARLSIRRRVDSALTSAREGGRTVADIATHVVKEHPVPLAMVAVPLIWMVLKPRRHKRH
jgi:hypothetical protein